MRRHKFTIDRHTSYHHNSPVPTCCVPNCDRPVIRRKWYCQTHYFRIWRYGTLELRNRSRSPTSDVFDIMTADKAWVLGVIWSDGNLLGHRVQVTSTDIEIVNQISSVLGTVNAVRPKGTTSIGKSAWEIAFANKRISEKLRSMGLHERKSHTIRWPVGLNSSIVGPFLRGVFDGDGTVVFSNKPRQQRPRCTAGIYSASIGFTDDIIGHLFDHGIQAVRHQMHRCYRVTVLRNDGAKRFYDLIYGDTGPRLSRKYDKFTNWYVAPTPKQGRPASCVI